MPLERDPTRGGELLLRLPPPHSNIIITPPRDSDIIDQIETMNDLNVVKWLQGPPYPYTMKDSEEWNEKISKECAEGEAMYEQIVQGKHAPALECAPVRNIREVDTVTGAQKYIGDVYFRRAEYHEIVDKDQRAKVKAANDALEPGDPAILWEFGDLLASSHHGRGIMTAVIKAFIEELAIPYCNAHVIQAGYYTTNVGSKRVFEKNGFTQEQIVPNAFTQSEVKGGQVISLGRLTWRRPTE